MKNMQKMNTTKGALLGLSVGAAALIAAACSGDKTNPTTVPGATTTAPTAVVPPVGATTTGPVGATTGPVGATTSGATGATTTGATGAVPPPVSTCTTLTYEDENLGNDNANFSATRSIYVYGDAATSACTDDMTTLGTVCVEGNALPAESDYSHWGAGIGLQLAETDGTGALVAPWNATALGITQLRFTVSSLAGRPLRVQISQVDDPAITTAANNYQANGFLYGGSSPKKAADGVNTFALVDFELPTWAGDKIAVGLGLEDNKALPEGSTILDPSKLHSLQFQVASEPADDPEKYSFCISAVEWLDAAGNVVPVTVTETGGTGETGGTDTGASAGSGTDTGVSGGSDTSAPATSASGGSDTSAPAEPDVYAIFQAKCGGAANCHGDGESHPRKFASATLATAQAAADAEKMQAAQRVAAGTMPPPGSPALSDDEKAAVAAWAAAQ